MRENVYQTTERVAGVKTFGDRPIFDIETAAGDFAATLNPPPLGQPHLWLITDDLSINSRHALGWHDVSGPTA